MEKGWAGRRAYIWAVGTGCRRYLELAELLVVWASPGHAGSAQLLK